jgi:hypothetical protein
MSFFKSQNKNQILTSTHTYDTIKKHTNTSYSGVFLKDKDALSLVLEAIHAWLK